VDAAALRDAVRAAGVDTEPVFLDVAESTNSTLLAMAQRGAPTWTVVAAREQTGGRGRLGRGWHSPPDASLALSILLRPDADPSRLPLLSLAAGVAMAEACADVARVAVRCKWPNDLVIEGRKVGGILSEAVVRAGRPTSVVIGTGVNLSQRPEDFPPEIRPLATSLRGSGGTDDGPGLVSRFLRGLVEIVERFDPTTIVSRYRPLCVTLGHRVVVATTWAGALEGRAVDVDDTGALLVETGAATERVSFGEVEHVR